MFVQENSLPWIRWGGALMLGLILLKEWNSLTLTDISTIPVKKTKTPLWRTKSPTHHSKDSGSPSLFEEPSHPKVGPFQLYLFSASVICLGGKPSLGEEKVDLFFHQSSLGKAGLWCTAEPCVSLAFNAMSQLCCAGYCRCAWIQWDHCTSGKVQHFPDRQKSRDEHVQPDCHKECILLLLSLRIPLGSGASEGKMHISDGFHLMCKSVGKISLRTI